MLTLEVHLVSPVFFTVTSSGVVSALLAVPPAAFGRSTWMFTVRSGAATMKMMSSTSITSTIGVTLISAMTGLRPPRRRPPPPDPAMLIAMIVHSQRYAWCNSAPLVDLTRQDGGELVGEPFQALGLPVHLRDELI